MKIKLVIFDLDGTLMDAYQAVEASVNYTMVQLGLPAIDADTIKRTVGWGERHLVETFVGEKFIDQALAVYREHHLEAIKQGTTLLPGAQNVLDYLKEEGYKMAIASNRPSQFSLIAIEYLGIGDYFDFVLCADQVSLPKPAPDLLLEILKKFSLHPQESVYVGDMTIDVETGKKADVYTVVVLTGSSTKDEISPLKPNEIIHNVYELTHVLEDLN